MRESSKCGYLFFFNEVGGDISGKGSVGLDTKWKGVEELLQGSEREDCRDESRDPQVLLPAHRVTHICVALGY